MNIDKANEVAKIVDRINKCNDFLQSLEGRSYNDEFTIHYRGLETCDLEEPALKLLIEHYKKELKTAEQKLQKL